MGFPGDGWDTLGSDTGNSGLRTCLSHTRMLQTLKELEARSSEAKAKAAAFQHLLLLVGIHLFKVRQPVKEGLWTWHRLERLEGLARKGSGELNFTGFLSQVVLVELGASNS